MPLWWSSSAFSVFEQEFKKLDDGDGYLTSDELADCLELFGLSFEDEQIDQIRQMFAARGEPCIILETHLMIETIVPPCPNISMTLSSRPALSVKISSQYEKPFVVPETLGFESWSHERQTTSFLSIQNHFLVPARNQNQNNKCMFRQNRT